MSPGTILQMLSNSNKVRVIVPKKLFIGLRVNKVHSGFFMRDSPIVVGLRQAV